MRSVNGEPLLARGSRRQIAVEQGLQMDRASAIEVQVCKRAGCVLEVTIAGFCVPVMQGTIKL